MKQTRSRLRHRLGLLSMTALLCWEVQASAEVIHFKFVSSGAEARTGGFPSQQLKLSTNRPAGIKLPPAGVVAPLFAELQLGPRDRARTYYLVLDEPTNAPARLFADTNGNGDFSDDGPVEWTPEKSANSEGVETYVSYSGTAGFLVTYGAQSANLGINFYRFDPAEPRRAEYKNSLLYSADYARTGEVTLGTNTYAAVLADTQSTGDFRPANSANTTNPPTTVLYLDVNHDGKLARRSEAFRAGKPFNLGGTTYELTNFTASGDSFELIKSAQTVEETKPQPNLTFGHQAPAFEAQTTDSAAVKFPEAYQGKVLLLDFWATWCGPCVKEVPHIVAAHEKFHNRGFEVLGVSLDRTNAAAKLASFTAKHRMTWPQIYDGNGMQNPLAKQYAVESIPQAFLVDVSTGLILAEGDSLRGTNLAPAIVKALEIKPVAAPQPH